MLKLPKVHQGELTIFIFKIPTRSIKRNVHVHASFTTAVYRKCDTSSWFYYSPAYLEFDKYFTCIKLWLVSVCVKFDFDFPIFLPPLPLERMKISRRLQTDDDLHRNSKRHCLWHLWKISWIHNWIEKKNNNNHKHLNDSWAPIRRLEEIFCSVILPCVRRDRRSLQKKKKQKKNWVN